MQYSEQIVTDSSDDLGQQVVSILSHLDHVLPGQAPLHDFVHHNTLHGYQHLPFEQALQQNEAVTGVSGFLPETKFREFYQQGRINDTDINAAFQAASTLETDNVVCRINNQAIKRADIYKAAMLFDLAEITENQLNWQLQRESALEQAQKDVPQIMANKLLAGSTDTAKTISLLWQTLLSKLNLDTGTLSRDDLLDANLEQIEDWLGHYRYQRQYEYDPSQHSEMQQVSAKMFDELLATLGDSITMRGFILALTGTDILDSIRPYLIRICASGMDEGIAPWVLPDREKRGIYGAWRLTLRSDASPFFQELPNWHNIVAELPEDAITTIILHLDKLAIPRDSWQGYLQCLALELPGWSGMINWRQHHLDYTTENDAKPNLADYLAIRLTLDRLWLNHLCYHHWRIAETSLTGLQAYFRKSRSEFMVRHLLYQGKLPEYLTQQAEFIILRLGQEKINRDDWRKMADILWAWKNCPLANHKKHSDPITGWRLFRLCQHLGLNADAVQDLSKDQLLSLLQEVDDFTVEQHHLLWLDAYERNYRDRFLNGIRANLQRKDKPKVFKRSSAQVIFCMDEREESIRRHLEEQNPDIETLGAAGFFGVPMYYKGLDTDELTALSPVVVTPSHKVHETERCFTETVVKSHKTGLRTEKTITYGLHQASRRHLWLSHLVIDFMAPVTLLALIARTFIPDRLVALRQRIRNLFVPPVPTELTFIATDPEIEATPEQPRLGFTSEEQADRIGGFLKLMGLTGSFSPIICVMGHGSTSQNNPHEAAHDCGACSGRQGGPNARLFAAMANRPIVRGLLAERGIDIPDDTWFVGGQHDTCSDEVTWYDLADIPENSQLAFQAFYSAFMDARDTSAHERCRRFSSAKNPQTALAGLCHVRHRSNDLSQVRPEFGHATNAVAVIGRRSVTKGLFMDRRAFLISYDPSQDPQGNILETILLTAGPVGAGINLEYYFSTIDNENFGCGTKVPHNLIGLFGVMEGTNSDLRTGLPKQMVEIHEAMRLQVIVEAKTSVLEQIYQRQASLQELIGHGWIHLIALDPDNGDFSIFERGVGFVPWQHKGEELEMVNQSKDWYQGKTYALSPALIRYTTVLQEA